MVSLDVDSRSTNVSLGKTIKTCIGEFFWIWNDISGLNKKEISEMVSSTLKEFIISFGIKNHS